MLRKSVSPSSTSLPFLKKSANLETQGDPDCVNDLRYASRASAPPKLPLCTLRPVVPKIEHQPQRADGEQPAVSPYSYVHDTADQERHTIQKNNISAKEYADYCIAWRWDDHITDPESEAALALGMAGRGKLSGSGEFARSLKVGDVVTIWGTSRMPAWINYIERVSVDVYWAV